MVPAPLNKTHSAIREHVFAAYEDAKQAGVHLEERIAEHVHAADERKKLFSEIPRIEGERIILDRVVDADADALRDLIDNPFAQRYLPTYLFEKQFNDAHEAIRLLYGNLFENKVSIRLRCAVGWCRWGGFPIHGTIMRQQY